MSRKVCWCRPEHFTIAKEILVFLKTYFKGDLELKLWDSRVYESAGLTCLWVSFRDADTYTDRKGVKKLFIALNFDLFSNKKRHGAEVVFRYVGKNGIIKRDSLGLVGWKTDGYLWKVPFGENKNKLANAMFLYLKDLRKHFDSRTLPNFKNFTLKQRLKEIEDAVSDLVLFKSKEHNIEVSSEIACEFHRIFRKWLQDTDEQIRKNLGILTCDNIREIYFAFWGELKYWRSGSSGFTGFSETLLFRTLYHTIGEKFNLIESGDSRDPIRFESENYEIGQSITIKINGKRICPDIYVKRNNQLISIIQIKTFVDSDSEIDAEVKTFEMLKARYPMIKGLFIVFVKSGFKEKRAEKLRKIGYETLVLQDNNDSIATVLRKFI